jgi:hypothetical protein
MMWKDLLEESPVELVEIDVAGWLGRAALDVSVVSYASPARSYLTQF